MSWNTNYPNYGYPQGNYYGTQPNQGINPQYTVQNPNQTNLNPYNTYYTPNSQTSWGTNTSYINTAPPNIQSNTSYQNYPTQYETNPSNTLKQPTFNTTIESPYQSSTTSVQLPYPSNTTGQSSYPSNTTGQSSYPSNTTVQSPYPSNTTGQSSYPSNTTGQSSHPSNTTGQSSYPSNTTGQSLYQNNTTVQPPYQTSQPNYNQFSQSNQQQPNLDTDQSSTQSYSSAQTNIALSSQNDMFMHQMKMEKLNKERKSRQEELIRRQSQVEMKQRELEAQKKQLEDHQRMIAINIERERSKIREKKEQREKELAKLESQIRIKQRVLKKEDTVSKVKSEDDIQMKESLYSYFIETSKNLAKNSNRILDLSLKNHAQILIKSSEERSLYAQVIVYFEGLMKSFKCTLDESILNFEDIDSSIGSSCRNVIHSSQNLINTANKILDSDGSKLMNQQEFGNNVKQNVIAVIHSIKQFVEDLEKLKISEGLGNESTKILSIAIDEAEKLVDNVLIEKNVKSDIKEGEKKPLLLGTFDSSKVELSSYPEHKIKKIQSILQKWIISHKFRIVVDQWKISKQSSNLRKRYKLLLEVVETEKRYVESLQVCKDHFYLPFIQNSKRKGACITESQIHSLFGSFEKILDFSNIILRDMQDRLSKWPTVQLFGDILVDRSNDMLLYADYVNNYDDAMITYSKLKANPKFVELERKCMDSSTSKMDTPSLLIMPIQRLPRYQLLLRELVEHTIKDHIDYNNLVEAKESITKINVEINKRKQEYDNAQELKRIKNEIQPNNAINLETPNKMFIKSTFATFKSKESNSGCIYLFNDSLILSKSARKASPPPYMYIETILFHETDIVLQKRLLGKHCFKLLDKSGKKQNWKLTFSSDNECEVWFNEISESIETHSLRNLLDSNMLQGEDSKDKLIILSATYGDLSKSHYCIDVSMQLQNIVNSQGGKSLNLSHGSKKHLPGFSDPVKGKKKNLLIVFSTSGFVKTRSYEDEEIVKLP